MGTLRSVIPLATPCFHIFGNTISIICITVAQVSEDPDVLVVSSYPLALSCLEERREQVTSSVQHHTSLHLHL